ncbi:MAG: hypothetical protein VYC34_00560 [Planctomycetota bacterium]|nr:hypothetical protein [Planctomycetota bacterium]
MNIKAIYNSTRVLPLPAAFLSACAAVAGPLDPPPGPPAPTGRTLDQVEPSTPIEQFPATINSPGVYHLTSNVVVSAQPVGITINADDVTIDLRGFTLQGANGSLSGIRCPQQRTNIRVIDGILTGWANAAIDMPLARECQVENIFATSNSDGIDVGFASIVRDCHVRDNGGAGILARAGSIVEACVAFNNTISGIVTEQECIVRQCVSRSNGASVVPSPDNISQGDGIYVGADSLVEACVSTDNTGDGVHAGANSSVAECAVARNVLAGVLVEQGAVARSCAARDNVDEIIFQLNLRGLLLPRLFGGVVAGEGSTVVGCATTNNLAAGVVGGRGSTVVACTALNNGFTLPNGPAITDDRGNGLDPEFTFQQSSVISGIAVSESADVRHCAVAQNASFGVFSLGGGVTEGCAIHMNGARGLVPRGFAIGDYSNGGVIAYQSGIVRSCAVSLNLGGPGVQLDDGLAERNCATENDVAGVYFSGAASIIQNLCVDNGNEIPAVERGDPFDRGGIVIRGSAGRVDGNHVVDNAAGIATASGAGSNFVVRNSAQSNGLAPYVGFNSLNWGPIVNTLSPNPMANYRLP